MDEWLEIPYERAISHLNGKNLEREEEKITTHLEGEDKELYIAGKEVYEREGHCITCHQANGEGLESSGFPPLKQAKWVTEDEDRLIKLTLNGITGPIVVQNRQYPGSTPMTPFGGILSDEEVAAVLTYVRNSFGHRNSVVSPKKVKAVRDEIKDKKGFYTADELLQQHPHKIITGKALVN